MQDNNNNDSCGFTVSYTEVENFEWIEILKQRLILIHDTDTNLTNINHLEECQMSFKTTQNEAQWSLRFPSQAPVKTSKHLRNRDQIFVHTHSWWPASSAGGDSGATTTCRWLLGGQHDGTSMCSTHTSIQWGHQWRLAGVCFQHFNIVLWI